MGWVVSLEGRNDGPTNMGRDVEALARAEAGIASARVYGWDGPWVSLGRFQQPARALRSPDRVPWVMRPTGGKAVLHGHDVTVGVAAPLASLGLKESEFRSVRAAYRQVIRPIVQALRACGVPAVLGEETPFVRAAGKTADCFAHVAPNDVVDERTGAKLCGCALRLTSSAVLVQASIPAGPPLVSPSELFDLPHRVVWSAGLTHQAFAEALRGLVG